MVSMSIEISVRFVLRHQVLRQVQALKSVSNSQFSISYLYFTLNFLSLEQRHITQAEISASALAQFWP
jgi:hypothetical protein